MASKHASTSDTAASTRDTAAGARAGEASGKHQGLRQPADDQRDEDKLGQVGLRSRGSKFEDHLRDKRGKGVAGDYDDSIDHDADQGYVPPGAGGRPARDS